MRSKSRMIAVVAVLSIIALVASISGGCKKAEASGGVFSAYIMQPVSLDPPNCYESEGIQVIRQVWDGLFDYDRKTLEIVPELCEKWEVSNDGLVYTFYLKKGVKFHDGSPLTAGDFVYAWTRASLAENATALGYHLSPIKGYDACADGTAKELEGVKALDDNTLQVTLSYPYADFVKTLGHVVFYPLKKADIDKWGADYTKHINGTGPFKLVEWVDDQHIKLVRNDDYYGEKAKLDEVDYKIFADENTAFLEFKAGNVDYTQIPIGKIKATVDDPKYKDSCYTSPMLGILYYGMALNFPVFKDNPKLREALNYAIDYDNICDVLYEGIPKPATGIVPKGIPGFQENASPYKYDLEKAKQLLAEAGFPNGEGLPTLQFGFNTGSGHEILGEALQAEFAKLGIKMEIQGYEWGALLDKAKSGEITFYRLGWQADYPTMDNFLYPLFYSKSYDNYGGYSNPEVDKMLLEARSIADEKERTAKYREIEKTVINDNAFLLIYFYGLRRVTQSYVKGFELDAMENYDLSKVWLEK
jgi:oligopeptide transport system substrate-binding protein